MKSRKSVLITDLDNTLFDWFDMWYASNLAMYTKVSEISGVDLEILLPEVKAVHQKHGTAEYAFVLESLPSLQSKYGDRDSINGALDEAIYAFRSSRKKHLKLYPSVQATLSTLKEKGVLIVAYTESKSYYTSFRLKKLGLDAYIDFLFSSEDHSLPEEVGKGTVIDLSQTQQYFTPKGEIKPNPKLLLDIIERVGAKVDDCVYIGDSEMKDIEMAQQAGVTDVFAKYGTSHFDTNKDGYELLRAVTHWTDEDVERERKIKESYHHIPPSHTVNEFSELLGIFDFKSFKEV
ncbi:Phosphoglycolate phosphatase [Photobacterium damselae subsp. piscicida]|uniref:phosphoglycolate phosphatase n=1 Tax=Photobacterium damsela subsp. piscicida TaxID=38294 RepID=A0A1V1V8E2_PHODP|nr:HAD family hydrolase [Photobacterium damselae]MBE8130186.1 HAD family hydrolase [Photobacterium damselae subsp. piscicida]MDP2515615.1 HAD family hydrolase [Photobacterium damselae subsp. piscicida]MDP2532073.1 HAD family hydrolase [Photobacterium damselae subsp. piscicida]MDP2543264.1 HAD family hydrolase [Photobacterium damselae subsp. piscicida]MDP2556287.1 HAD family hydrolase [Photobacterium damselae subsp. piscicida]